jgi:surfeit locus 1 family protein
VPIKFGSRVFEPRPFTTLLTIALIGVLLSLGRWQLIRAGQKQALYDLFDSGAERSRVIDAATPPLPRYQHVQASGRYDSTRQILIDNISNAASRAGYYVITPFALDGGGWILVNRGWVPVGASRAEKPSVAVSADARALHGRTDNLPRAGLRLGGAALVPPYPVVANYPTGPELRSLLQESHWADAAEVVLLDAREPDGYLREWQPPGFPPVRHVAYAVQWFGLALTLAVIYVVTHLRRATTAAGKEAS